MNHLAKIELSNMNVSCTMGGLLSISKEMSWKLKCAICYQHKFYYILDGSCVINIKGKDFFGKPGDLFLIPATTDHSYYNLNGQPFKKMWFHFDLKVASVDFFQVINLPYCLHVGLDGKIISLFREILQLRSDNKITSVIRLKARIYDLLSEYMARSDIEDITIDFKGDNCIEEVLHYIEANLSANISNEQLAEVAHMHPSHFIRFFKSKMGQTPAKYVNLQKMNQARFLLENTNMTASEIMQFIGMNDISHFSKLFKNIYNISPIRYRQNYRSFQI